MRRGLFLFLFLLPLSLRAAFEEKSASARALALGDSVAGDGGSPDAWGANPAALRSPERAWFSAGHTRLLGEASLPVSHLSLSLPTEGRGSFGASFQRFGNALYAESEASIAHAFRLAPGASLGVALTGYTVDMSRYGRRAAWGVDAGILGRPRPGVSLGASVRRLNRPRLGQDSLPALTRAGASVRLPGEAWLSAELAKSRGDPFSARLGLEVFPVPVLCFRVGGQSRPSRYSAGLGVAVPSGRVDYAFLTHPLFGDQHVVSFSVPWGQPRRRL